MSAAPWLTALCLAFVAGLVAAEWRDHAVAKRLCKLSASVAFILVALALKANASHYGQLVLVALVLGAVGDAFLLSRRSRFFMAGLGSFLLAHLAYAGAFTLGDRQPTALAVAAVAMGAVGLLTLHWLWARLSSPYRWAVSAYVAAIAAMVVLAAGRAAASGAWPLALGAVAFAASDLAVARERFVASGFINRAWGLPLYYAAQLTLAWTLTDPALTA